MLTINHPKAKLPPVAVDFWWENGGPIPSFTFDGDTYPYKHQADEVSRASDSRYEIDFTTILTPIEFTAVSSEHPKVETPPGVTIVEYIWDFGDGTVAYGPTPIHTYTVQSPDTRISLTVFDSRGLQFSGSKPLNLKFSRETSFVGYKIRG